MVQQSPFLKDNLEPPSLYEPFSFHHWYPYLKRHTFESIILDLPQEFVEYLGQDGIQVASETKFYDYDMTVDTEAMATETSYGSTDDEAFSQEPPDFPDLVMNITQAIRQLGGNVFPKLNWSCPMDAAFMNFDGTLKCSSYDQILILLKSSDFVQFDLCHSVDRRILVLRKWHDLHPSHEFRCWVIQGRFLAMCQRDIYHFYPFLTELKPTLLQRALKFHHDVLQAIPLPPSYVFDLYFSSSDLIPFLVDINPFSVTTDPLLFAWPEFSFLSSGVEFRCVQSPLEASQTAPPFAAHRVPYDMVLFSEGHTVMEFSEKWMEYVKQACTAPENDDEQELCNRIEHI